MTDKAWSLIYLALSLSTVAQIKDEERSWWTVLVLVLAVFWFVASAVYFVKDLA